VVVSRILGHLRISVTLDVYRHVLESELREHVTDLFDQPLPVRVPPGTVAN
jgi:site-specific recombinase XerD